MATLTLTLSAGDIKKAVKSDTYITGQIDKAANTVNNASLAYNEAAGDESYHEVKLYRTMKGAVSKFEANLTEFVDPTSGASVGNTLTSSTGDGTFKITLPVGSRFYGAFANTLSALAQEYIINMMLYAWWQSIKPAMAKDYYQFAQESLTMVTKTLSKTPPTTTLATYKDVTGTIGDGTEQEEGETPEEPDPLAQYDIRGEAKALLQYYWDGTYQPNGQPSNGDLVLFDYGDYPIARYNPSVAHVSQFEAFDAALEAGRTAYWVGNNLCVFRGYDGVGATPQDQNSNTYWTVKQNMR